MSAVLNAVLAVIAFSAAAPPHSPNVDMPSTKPSPSAGTADAGQASFVQSTSDSSCRELVAAKKSLDVLRARAAKLAATTPEDLRAKREAAPRNENDEKAFVGLFRSLVVEDSVRCGADVCAFKLKAASIPAFNEAQQKLMESPWHAAIFVRDSSGVDVTEMQHTSLTQLDGVHAVRAFLGLLLFDPSTKSCMPFGTVHAHVDERGTFTVTSVDGGGPGALACLQAKALTHQAGPLPDGTSVTVADASAAAQ